MLKTILEKIYQFHYREFLKKPLPLVEKHFNSFLTVSIFILSIISIQTTIDLEKSSTYEMDTGLAILAVSNSSNRFISKNDLTVRLLSDEVDLPRQVYIYSRIAVGDSRDNSELEKEAEQKIGGIQDYFNKVNIERTLKVNKMRHNFFIAQRSYLQTARGQNFMLLIILNIFIIALSSISGRHFISAKLKESHTKNYNTHESNK